MHKKQWIPLTGELVLRTLDEHSGQTFDQLQEDLGLNIGPGPMALISALSELASAGLAAIDGMTSDETHQALRGAQMYEYMWGAPHTWRTTAQWMAVTKALADVHLGSRRPENATRLLCYPVFGPPGHHLEQADIFVVMPFTRELRPVYDKCLVPTARSMQLSIARADDFYTHSAVMTDIWSAVYASSLVVADCTGRNPNVFYELGIAHTLGVPAMMISQSEDDIPSDLRHLRYYVYKPSAAGLRQLGEAVCKVLTATMLDRNV